MNEIRIILIVVYEADYLKTLLGLLGRRKKKRREEERKGEKRERKEI